MALWDLKQLGADMHYYGAYLLSCEDINPSESLLPI